MIEEQTSCRFSSFVLWARYDRERRVLEIDFKAPDGRKRSTYAYENFPPDEWEFFLAARRRGEHFAYRIRPRFTGKKVWFETERRAARSAPERCTHA
jgi:hypothetical protein